VRIEVTPHVSPLAVGIVTALTTTTLTAGLVAAWPSAFVLAAASLAVVGRLAWESGVATAWLLRAGVPSSAAPASTGSPLVPEQA
jgi:hypothetical protein